VECIDFNGKPALENINNNNPIFEKIYPFMEMHLVTRLKLKFNNNDELYNMVVTKESKKKKFDLIILIEGNVSNLDSSLYEVYKYTLDGSKIENTVDFYTHNSIELDYENYSNSDGFHPSDK